MERTENEDACLLGIINKDLLRAVDLYKSDKIIKAYRVLQTCDSFIDSLSAPAREQLLPQLEAISEIKVIRKIGKQVADLFELIRGLVITFWLIIFLTD